MEAIYTAVASSIGGRNGVVKSSDGVLDLEVRPPKEMGGTGGNYTNPEQLFAAGYATCFNSALQHVSLAKGIRMRPVVTAKVSIGKRPDGEGYMLAVEMDIEMGEVDKNQVEELVQAAHQLCPYSNAIRNNVEVNLNIL